MSNELQPTTLPALITPEKFGELMTFLQVRRDAAVTDLQSITTITNEEEAEAANDTLVMAKKLYDQMSARRKAFTDPIKDAIAIVMEYENAINYTAKSDNEYNRARKVLEDWNQAKLEAKKKAEYDAWLKAEQTKYKVEFKSKIKEQLEDMLTGVNKTLIDGMMNWEAGLTLENFDARVTALKGSQPALRKEHWEKCFRKWGQKPDVMAPAEEEEYLKVLQDELTYEIYNERYQQIAAPLKNEYLAKVDVIKAHLEEKAKASEAERKKIEAEKAKEAEAKRISEAKRLDEERKAKQQQIADEADIDKMQADFVQQATTQDLEAPPKKLVGSFEDVRLWLKPLQACIAKVALSPKFKGILDKSGGPKKEVQWWIDQYVACVGEPLEGLKLEEEAKTIVKKK